MIKVNDLVFILPAASLKFCKRWGKVVEIVPSDPMPLRVKFSESPLSYRFGVDEVLTERAYEDWQGCKVYCSKCGKDITGEYTTICVDCAFPIPEEEDDDGESEADQR